MRIEALSDHECPAGVVEVADDRKAVGADGQGGVLARVVDGSIHDGDLRWHGDFVADDATVGVDAPYRLAIGTDAEDARLDRGGVDAVEGVRVQS